jgi:ATP dependent DNA ligase C terminal region
MAKLRPLEIAECPFANLPEARAGRWGEGFTADKMKEYVWVRPKLVAEVEFVEWTPDRHSAARAVRGDGRRVGFFADGNGLGHMTQPARRRGCHHISDRCGSNHPARSASFFLSGI